MASVKQEPMKLSTRSRAGQRVGFSVAPARVTPAVLATLRQHVDGGETDALAAALKGVLVGRDVQFVGETTTTVATTDLASLGLPTLGLMTSALERQFGH